MKQKILFLCFLVLLPIGNLLAQGEAAYWYFGQNTGLNFSDMQTLNNVTLNGVTGQVLSGIPKSISGPIYTGEGCFSISDKDGNFLFASDGITVYNGPSSGNVMRNGTGLKGHSSAAQSGVVIPRPETTGRFYIVTAPCRASSPEKEIFYSEIDFTVTNAQGRGEVIAAGKNTKLSLTGLSANQAYENIGAVGNSDGKNFWLINFSRGYFYVWKITKSGFTYHNRFNSGLDHGAPVGTAAGAGQLKISRDGRYIGVTAGFKNLVFAHFDNSSGNISSIQTRNFAAFNYAYGVEFSPNSEYLYIGNYTSYMASNGTGGGDGIWALPTNNILGATPRFVVRSPGTTIQLGPDNRMYTCKHATRNLLIILDPDEGGYQIAEIPNHLTNLPADGLPTFVASFFSATDINTNPLVPACINKEIEFSVQINTGVGINRATKLSWDFGDGSPVEEESDMNKYTFSNTHAYAEPGTYTLTLTPYKSDGSILTDKIKTLEVKISRCLMPVNPNIHLMN